jgi:uncharacterized protein (TIGR03435 family)
MKATHLALSTLFGAAALCAQPKPEFEVASIRPANINTAQQGEVNIGIRIDGAQISVSAYSLKDYIGLAYRVKSYQITGPDWIGSERYRVTATIPAGVPQSQIPEMMQALLEDRFQLKLHREKKEFPVYALETDKGGIKMQAVAQDPSDPGPPTTNVAGNGSAQGVAVNLGNGSSYTFVPNHFEAKKLGMTTLANNLERFMDRPVVDLTGTKDQYDFTLELTEDDYRGMLIHAAVNSGVVLPPQALKAMENSSFGSLFSAMQKLGLKLEAKKAPLDFLVVDSARKTPTEN